MVHQKFEVGDVPFLRPHYISECCYYISDKACFTRSDAMTWLTKVIRNLIEILV